VEIVNFMSEDATVYVIDNDQAARESVAAIVRSKGVQVRELESGEALLAELPTDGHLCLIVDVDLPGLSGLELQPRLQQAGKSLPVVMVGRPDVAVAVKAMQQGAVTYLQKPCSREELTAAIEVALERASRQQAERRQKEDLRNRFEQLTASERQVLTRVIEGQPNRQIADEMDIGLRTVELRRSNIMRKTGASNLCELIRLSIEVGFPNGLATVASEAGKSNGEPVADQPS
jgi:two-component system, LuxR family, response regulator FixJ